jgi:hypothetical protein
MHNAGFDTAEPRTRYIAVLGSLMLVLLVAVILGLQWYFDRIREHQIFVKVLEPVASDLRSLRAREDAELHSYRYIERAKGRVRIPIDRAMELLVSEQRENDDRAAD